MSLADITLQAIGFRLVTLLVLAPVQGGAMAGAAVLLGDRGPRYDGRLTASPGPHIDGFGAAGLVLFGLGWSRPVEIDPREIRGGGLGLVAVVLAGVFALIATAALMDALVAPALRHLPHSAALTTAAFLREASGLTLWWAVASLVPVPPLAAGLWLRGAGIVLSRQVQWIVAALVLAAVATGILRQGLGPIQAALAGALLGG